jgi:hypothetical protein
MRSIKHVSLLFVLLFVQTTIFGAPLDQTNALEKVTSDPDMIGAQGGDGTDTLVHTFKAIGSNLNMNRADGSPAQNTLTWKSLFPMEGIIRLEDQKLDLDSDLRFSGNGNFSTLGTIAGNNYFITLSPRTTNFPETFVAGQTVDLSGTATVASDFSKTVTACDWSFDGQFVAALHNGTDSGDDTLTIFQYAFDDPSTLTQRAEDELIAGNGDSASCVRIAQNTTFDGKKMIAVGRAEATSPNLILYHFLSDNPYTLTEGIVQQDGEVPTAIGLGDAVYAVAWRPEGEWKFGGGGQGFPGSHLAVVFKNGNDYFLDILRISPDGRIEGVVNDGNQKTLPGKPTGNNLSWNMRADAITLACGNKVVAYEVDNSGILIAKGPNGSASQVDAPGARVAAFHPHMPFILAGVNNDVNAFSLFEMSPNGLQAVSVTITTTDAVNFNDLNFKEDGFEIAAATSSGLRTFNFNPRAIFEGGALLSNRLNMDKRNDVHCARWNWDRIAREYKNGAAKNLVVNEFGGSGGGGSIGGKSADFENVFLELNSPVTLNNNITIAENCTIEGNNNKLTLADGVRIFIRNGKTLTLKNTVLKGIRGRAEQFNGVQQQKLESINFESNTATLKLENSTLVPTTNLFIDQGTILLADEQSSMESGGKTIEFLDPGSQFQDSRSNFSGTIDNFQGDRMTLDGDAHFKGGMDLGRIDGGGNVLHFDDMKAWPSGSPVDLNNTATPIYSQTPEILVPVNAITIPFDGRFSCYVNTNTGTASTDNAVLRVDKLVAGNEGQNQITTPTRWARTLIGGVASKKNSNVFDVLWRPRPGQPVSGGGMQHQIIVLWNAAVADLSKAGFAEMYGFVEKTSSTSTLAPMKADTSAMVTPLATDAAGMKITAATWDNFGDRLAVAVSDGTNHYVRIYKVKENGNIPTTPLATVALTEAVNSKQLYWTRDFRKLVWAGPTKIGALDFDGNASLRTVGTDPSIPTAILAPHPHEPMLIAGTGANIYVYNMGGNGNLVDMGMTIPLNQETNSISGNNVNAVYDLSWHDSGNIMAVSTDHGVKLLEFDPTQQKLKPMIQGGELDTRTVLAAEWVRDGKTLVRATTQNDDHCLAQVFARKSGGSLSNATVSIKNDFTIVGDVTIEADTAFDCNGQEFTISTDAVVTIAAGVVLTIRNASKLSGLRGEDDGNGNMAVKNLIMDSTSTLVLDNTPLNPNTPLYFTTGNIKIINGNFQLENNNQVSFADDGNVRVDLELGRKFTGQGGTGRARLDIPTAAQNYDISVIETKMEQLLKSAITTFDTNQNMIASGEHQQTTFDLTSKGAVLKVEGGADANDRTSKVVTDESVLEVSGPGVEEIVDFVEYDFQGSVGETIMEIKDEATLKITANANMVAKGSPNYHLKDGGSLDIEVGATAQFGDSDTDTVTFDVAVGGKVNVAGAAALTQGTHTINIAQGGSVSTTATAPLRVNETTAGAVSPGVSALAALTIQDATFNGCLHMRENTDGSNTTVTFEDAKTKNMTMCFEEQLELSVEVSDLTGSMPLETLYIQATQDQANPLQHKTKSGNNAINLGGTMTDIGTQEVVSMYDSNGVQITVANYVAKSAAGDVEKVIVFDSAAGETIAISVV